MANEKIKAQGTRFKVKGPDCTFLAANP